MKLLIAAIILLALFLGGWYASGRDLLSFRDGLSRDFRRAGADVLNIEDVRELDAALERAIKVAKTDADRVVYRKLEFYAVESAKAINETESAKIALAEQKPTIAEAQLKQSEFHANHRRACLLELGPMLPDKTGQRPPAIPPSDPAASCRES